MMEAFQEYLNSSYLNFFCSNAIEKGMSIHEVANQAGHSNIHSTILFTNPSKKEMLEKMNFL